VPILSGWVGLFIIKHVITLSYVSVTDRKMLYRFTVPNSNIISIYMTYRSSVHDNCVDVKC